MIYMPIIMSALGLAYVFVRRSWVMKQDAGDGKMKEISDHIYEGALAFLNAEYRLLSVFVLFVSAVLAGISFIVPTTHILIVVSFIFGAFFSAYAGNIGMKIATKTNVRTTQAAKTSLPNALKISFAGGTVMGLGVAGLAVLGLTAFFIIFFSFYNMLIFLRVCTCLLEVPHLQLRLLTSCFEVTTGLLQSFGY